MSNPSPPLLPEQQAFDQHLRTLAQSAVRTVLELVMREELDAFIGAAWGACSPKRKGYRNGTYTRESSDSDGPTGRSGACPETAKASSPRRSLIAIVALYRTLPERTDADVRGRGEHTTSVGEVAQTLLGVA